MASSPDGTRFVSGASVDWKGYGAFLAGGALWLYYYGFVASVQYVGDAISSGVIGLGEFVATAITTILGGMGMFITSSWLSFLAAIRPFGPFAYIIAVGAVVVVSAIMFWGVSRLGNLI